MQHGGVQCSSSVRPVNGPFISHAAETIYRSLFVQARGVLKKELIGHLRSERTIRRSKRADPNGDRRGANKDLVSISARPAAVEDRAVPGHCEGDLLSGSENSTRFDFDCSTEMLIRRDECREHAKAKLEVENEISSLLFRSCLSVSALALSLPKARCRDDT
jgi:IS30 family transposase